MSYASGLDQASRNSAYISCDEITLADIAAACELCLMTAEGRFAKALTERNLAPITPNLARFDRLGEHMTHLAGDPRFSEDLNPYFERLLPIWD